MVNDAPPGYREATFGQRLLARLVDVLVLLPAIIVIDLVADGRARIALGAIISGAYEIWMVSQRGQTVGKIALNTRIVDRSTGELPDTEHVVTRWLTTAAATLLTIAVPDLGAIASIYGLVILLPILRGPLHLGVHDMAAHTIVTSLREDAQPG
jgi:uncharacterized RDD family membrane protein YckC